MPKGEDYSIKEGQIMFRVIEFVEREKLGATVPLHTTNGRLLGMLGISESSLFGLMKKIADQRHKEQDEQEKQQLVRSRRRTTSSTELSRSHRKRRRLAISYDSSSIISTQLPGKKDVSSERPV